MLAFSVERLVAVIRPVQVCQLQFYYWVRELVRQNLVELYMTATIHWTKHQQCGFLHPFRHSGTRNSRQHFVGDCLVETLRRRQEFVSRLPRSVSHERPHLPDV